MDKIDLVLLKLGAHTQYFFILLFIIPCLEIVFPGFI
jgi:hypothetical protein